jgi:hypothetical protein
MQLNACIRTDAEVAAALRAWTGRSLFEPGNGAMQVVLAANPHRVFISRLGRIEVYQPIPPPDGKSPEGPHTPVLPRLLCHKRTHAATEFVPVGFVPCAHLYPPHPARDPRGKRRPFCQDRHASFQNLLARLGNPRMRVKEDHADHRCRARKGRHAMKDQLVGMFLVLESTGHEHYRAGYIAAAVGNCYLIEFDKVEEPEDHPLPPMELYALEELCRTCEDCGQKLANLFKTREDMMRWIAWLNEPEKPAGQSGKVVHLKKPH